MGIDYSDVSRVVIVIDIDDAVRVHVTRLGDEKVFHEIPERLRECIVQSAASNTNKTDGRQSSAENAASPLSGFSDDEGSWPPLSPES